MKFKIIAVFVLFMSTAVLAADKSGADLPATKHLGNASLNNELKTAG